MVQAITAGEKAREISFLSWKVVLSCLLHYSSAVEVLEWQRPQQPWPSHFFAPKILFEDATRFDAFINGGLPMWSVSTHTWKITSFQDVAKYIPQYQASPTMVFQFSQV